MKNPFKKEVNTGFSFELLPNKNYRIKINYNRRDSPEVLSIILNSFFASDPTLVDGTLKAIENTSKEEGWVNEASVVIANIKGYQKSRNAKLNPAKPAGRHPLISPKNVLTKLNNSITGEPQ